MNLAPVLFLIFNRPEKTLAVFEAIKKSKPSRLYIAADGPRQTVAADEEKCAKSRSIVELIDWDCEVKLLFRDENLGCKNAVSSGITWFFDHEPQGIILEDDCLPSPDFFNFCTELLERYKDNDRIGHICGCNFQDNLKRGHADYYFSKLTHVWGWASWRRVWKEYDIEMKYLNQMKSSDSLRILNPNKTIKSTIYKRFEQTKGNKINTWDFQYFYSNIANGFLSVIPNNNMIINIGFDLEGTHHTGDIMKHLQDQHFQPLASNIKHPQNYLICHEADEYTLKKEISSEIWSYLLGVRRKIVKVMRNK